MREVVQEMFEDAVRHHQAGRLVEAGQLFRMILMVERRHADSLYLLGLIAYEGGHHAIAVELIGQAIRIRKDNPFYYYNLGNALKAQGKIDDAVAGYKRALVLKPDYAEAHNNLGIILNEQGKRDDAVAHYERALALMPDLVYTHNNLANTLVEQGRIDDAVAHYERALVLKPDYADAHNNLGIALVAQGRIDDAVAHYDRALILNSNNADAHNNLGAVLKDRGRIDDAMAHYDRSITINPDHADAWNNRGIVLAEMGKVDDATAHYERAIAINPDHAEAQCNLGNALKEQGKFDDAMAHYERAITIKPDYAEAHLSRTEIKTFRRGDADLALLEALADRDDLPANKAMFIHFALSKALEDSGDYDRAFEHMRKGNVLKRRQIDYDEIGVLKLFQRISAVFDGSLFDRFQGEGDPSPVPVFVLGMPRSGSTLVEQILASHPQIHAAGELTALEMAASTIFKAGDQPVQYPECVPALDGATLRRLGQSYLGRLPALADGKVRIIDKLPGNFFSIGLIRLILPNAKIIHTMRDPVDTCVSCYSKLFATGLDFSYDLAELGRFYRCYSELMTHWRSVLPPGTILDVSYEEVVDDLEGQARRLIDYCGLPWDGRCIGFHRTSRPVKTASAVQVRKPLFRSSLQRWRKYEADIAPLLHELYTLSNGCLR